MIPPQTGTALRVERERRKLSQRACAEMIGCAEFTWYRWEMDHNEPKGASRRALVAWWADAPNGGE